MRASMFASRRTASLILMFGLMTVLLFGPTTRAESAGSPAAPVGPGASLSFSPVPEVYQGGHRYVAQAPTGRFTFDRTGFTLLPGPGVPTMVPNAASPDRPPASVRVQFEGTTGAYLAPEQPLPGVSNDFSAPDPRAWRIAAPTYRSLVYRQLHDGIDLQYEGLPGRFKGTYYIAPGADPADIRWRYDGAAAVEVRRETGELWVELPGRPISGAYLIEGAPLAWQEVGKRKVIVPASYEVDAEGVVGYALGPYDASRPLVIDPVVSLVASTGGR